MEDFNWSILGWIAGLVFVYLFGLFEGRGQGRKRRIAEEQEEKKEKKEKPAEPVKVDDPGLLRIKNEGGTMTLDLDLRAIWRAEGFQIGQWFGWPWCCEPPGLGRYGSPQLLQQVSLVDA